MAEESMEASAVGPMDDAPGEGEVSEAIRHEEEGSVQADAQLPAEAEWAKGGAGAEGSDEEKVDTPAPPTEKKVEEEKVDTPAPPAKEMVEEGKLDTPAHPAGKPVEEAGDVEDVEEGRQDPPAAAPRSAPRDDVLGPELTEADMESFVEQDPATPAKSVDSALNALDGSNQKLKEVEMDTPVKKFQAAAEAEQEGERLYYALLRATWRELGLYVQWEAGQLDPKKQLLVYHHAARLFELRRELLGALRGEPVMVASLPVDYQRATRALRQEWEKSKKLDLLASLDAAQVFGHEHVIKYLQAPNIPQAARRACIVLREKPHASIDHVKTITPFRDVVKFRCDRNPLFLIEDIGLGLVIRIEQTSPRAFLVISPFLVDPTPLANASAKTWKEIEQQLKEHLWRLVAEEADGWRSFIQRRASIVSQGSLACIQRVLRARPRTEGLDTSAAEALRELQEEVETMRARAEEAEGANKENSALEGKLRKLERQLAETKVVMSKLKDDEEAAREDLQIKTDEALAMEARARGAEELLARRAREIAGLEEKAMEAEGILESNMELLHEVAEVRASRKRARERGVCAREDADEAQKRRAVLEKALDNANSAVQKSVADCQVKSELVERLGASNVALRAEVAAAQVDVTQAADKAALAERELAQAKAETDKTNHLLQEQVAKVIELAAALHEEQSAATAARTKVEELAREAEAAKEHLQEAHAAEVRTAARLQVKVEESAALVAQCASLRGEVARLGEVEQRAATTQQALDSARAEVEVKGKTLENLLSTNATLRVEAQSSEEKAKAAEEKFNTLQTTAQEVQATLLARSQEVASLEAAGVELRREVEKAQKEVACSLAKVAEADKVAAECKHAERRMAAMVEVKTDEASGLTQECARLRAELDASKQRVEQVTSMVEIKTDEASGLAQECGRLRTELSTAKQEADRAVTLEAALEVQKSAHERLSASNVELRASLAECEAEGREAQGRADASARSLEELRAVHGRLQAALEAKVAEAAELGAALQDLSRKVAGAESEVAAAHERAAENGRLAEESRRAERRLAATVQIKAEEASGLADECSRLRAEVALGQREAVRADTLKAELEVQRTQAEHLLASNVELRAQAAQHESEAQGAIEKEKEAASQLAALQGVHAGMLSVLDAERVEAASLAVAVQELKVEAADAKERAARVAALEASLEQAEARAAEARRAEQCIAARLEIKTDEASGLADECGRLRAEVALRQREQVRAEALQAELEVQKAQAERLLASNVELRAEAALQESQAREAGAKEREAARRLKEFTTLHFEVESVLEAKRVEVASLGAKVRELKAEAEHGKERAARVAALEASLEQAEAQVAEARRAEHCIAARLEIKTDEVAGLTSQCGHLRAAAAQAEERAAFTAERSAAAERSEAAARGELQAKATTVAQLSAANIELRAQVTQASGQESEVREAMKRASAAEQQVVELQQACMKAEERLQVKAAEAARALEALARAEALQAAAQKEAEGCAGSISAAESAAEKATAEARAAEGRIRARLEVKTEEAKGLAAECAKLRAEAARLSEQESLARAKFQASSGAVASLTASCHALHEELEALKGEVATLRYDAEKDVEPYSGPEAELLEKCLDDACHETTSDGAGDRCVDDASIAAEQHCEAGNVTLADTENAFQAPPDVSRSEEALQPPQIAAGSEEDGAGDRCVDDASIAAEQHCEAGNVTLADIENAFQAPPDVSRSEEAMQPPQIAAGSEEAAQSPTEGGEAPLTGKRRRISGKRPIHVDE